MNIRGLLLIITCCVSNATYSDSLSNIHTHSISSEKKFISNTQGNESEGDSQNSQQSSESSNNSGAASNSEQPDMNGRSISERFVPFDVNYLTYASPKYDYNDRPLEAQVSLRYNFWNNQRLYMHFTNRFDFYLKTRESSPVVVRDERIGVRWIFNTDMFGLLEEGDGLIEAGITHWSNGQRTVVTDDITAPNGVTKEKYLKAYKIYKKSGTSESDSARDLVDSLSRSRNYIDLSATFRNFENLTLSVGGKVDVLRGDTEDKVYGNIDPDANFRHYDSFTFATKYDIRKFSFIYQLRIGEMFLATDSHDFSIRYNKDGFPLFIRYHHGPFQRLSDYTRPIDSIAIGFELSL